MFEMGDLGAPSAQRIQDFRNQYGSPSSLLVWAVVAVVVAWAVVAIVAVMAVMAVMAATYLTCQKHVGFNNFCGFGGSGGLGGTVPAVLAVRSRWLKPSRFTKLTVLAVLTVRPRRLWRYLPDGLAVVAVRSGGFGGFVGPPPTFTKNGRCWHKPGKHLNPQQANTEAAASTPNAAPLRLVAHMDGCVPDASHPPT